MKPNVKKLQLKKETLIALQEKQLRSIKGGNAGISMSFCAPTLEGCPIEPVSVTCAQNETEPGDSCCKKTCRRQS